MAYLNKTTQVLKAILTNKGREKLAQGAFNVSHFALADDEIDYTLWNTSSPSGSTGYDDYITKLPMFEAVPDDQTLMRYMLHLNDQWDSKKERLRLLDEHLKDQDLVKV